MTIILFILLFVFLPLIILAFIRNSLTLKYALRWNQEVYNCRKRMLDADRSDIMEKISYDEMYAAQQEYYKFFLSFWKWRFEDSIIDKGLYNFVTMWDDNLDESLKNPF